MIEVDVLGGVAVEAGVGLRGGGRERRGLNGGNEARGGRRGRGGGSGTPADSGDLDPPVAVVAVSPDGEAGAAVLLAHDHPLAAGGPPRVLDGGKVVELGGGSHRLDGLLDDLRGGDGGGGGRELGLLLGQGGGRQDESLRPGLEPALRGGAVLHLAQLAVRVQVAVLALHLAGGVPEKLINNFVNSCCLLFTVALLVPECTVHKRFSVSSFSCLPLKLKILLYFDICCMM